MEENDPQHQKTDINSIKEHLAGYIKNRFEYFKITLIEGISKTVPVLVLVLVVALFFIMFWVFANIAAVMALREWFDSLILGYLVVGGINALLAVVFIVAYKPLIYKPIGDLMVKLLTGSNQKDENE